MSHLYLQDARWNIFFYQIRYYIVDAIRVKKKNKPEINVIIKTKIPLLQSLATLGDFPILLELPADFPILLQPPADFPILLQLPAYFPILLQPQQIFLSCYSSQQIFLSCYSPQQIFLSCYSPQQIFLFCYSPQQIFLSCYSLSRFSYPVTTPTDFPILLQPPGFPTFNVF